MRRAARAVACLALLLGATTGSHAAPEAALQQLSWFVHVDLLDPGAGRDLDYYAGLIEQANADANVLLQGDHRSFDVPCCTELVSLDVQTFGSPGDGLDVIDSSAEFDALRSIGGSGSRAFLVDSMTVCGLLPGNPIGCADLPACDGVPGDDPDLTLVVTLDAAEFDLFGNGERIVSLLGETLAHERGHNACLPHVDEDVCQIMQAISSFGRSTCVSADECADYRAAGQATGEPCDCHQDAAGAPPASDAVADGLCSAGVCGEVGSDASVHLLAAGGPGAFEGVPTEDPLLLSGVTGLWTDLGAFGASEEPRGLAYAPERGVVFGLLDGAPDSRLARIDPATGAILGEPVAIAGQQDLNALAFDPGPSADPGDDRLFALRDDMDGFSSLLTIDPDTGAAQVLGGLSRGIQDAVFEGLAYDSANGVLYASGFGPEPLATIETGPCAGFCTTTFVEGLGFAPKSSSGLAYSPLTHRLYLLGSQGPAMGPLDRLEYESIDGDTLEALPTLRLEPFVTGGLAALPVPEPSPGLLRLAALGALSYAVRRRRRSSA